MDIFSLVAKLTLDTDEFDKELDKAESALDSFEEPDAPALELDNDDFNDSIEESQGLGQTFGTEMETVFKGIKSALTVTGIVGAITGIVNSLKEAVNMTAETADGIDKGSKRLGISRQAYQQWDHALRQSGAGINDLSRGLMNMQTAIKAADVLHVPFADAEDAVDGLADKTVGLSGDVYEALRDLDMLGDLSEGKFGSAEELMNSVLLKLADFEGSTEDRGILARKLFGRGGNNLNALLDEGAEGVKDLLSEAEDLGLIMTDEEINNAVAYGDAVANLKAELDAIKQAFVADIIPNLTSAVTNLTEFLAILNPRNRETGLQKTLEDIDKKALDAGNRLDDTGTKAELMIEKLASMGDYWTLDEQGKKTWNALAKEFVETYPQFAEYIDLENNKILGNTKEIEKNIDAWVRREKQALLDNAFAEKRAAVAERAEKAIEKGAEAMSKQIDADMERLGAIEKVNELMKDAGSDKRLGKDANYQQAIDFINANTKAGSDLELETVTAISEWGKLEEEAENLRKKAAELQEEADNAQAELEKNQQALVQYMAKGQTETDSTKEKVEELTKALLAVPQKIPISFPLFSNMFRPHAIGSDYIPYDNYPALLHRGERILTATEARQEGKSIDLSGLADSITAAVRRGMEGATVHSYLNGKDITDEVNRNNIQAVKGRRFR